MICKLATVITSETKFNRTNENKCFSLSKFMLTPIFYSNRDYGNNRFLSYIQTFHKPHLRKMNFHPVFAEIKHTEEFLCLTFTQIFNYLVFLYRFLVFVRTLLPSNVFLSGPVTNVASTPFSVCFDVKSTISFSPNDLNPYMPNTL